MKRLVAMGAYRLSLYLKEEGKTEILAAYPRLLSAEVTRGELAGLETAYMESLAGESGGIGRLFQLLSPYDEAGRLAWCALELALLYYMDGQSAAAFEAVQSGGRDGASIGMAAKLLYGSAAVLERFEILRKGFARCELLLQAEYPPKRIADTTLRADDRLVQWLAGEDSLLSHPLIWDGALNGESHSPIWEEKLQETLAELHGSASAFQEETSVVGFSGMANSGRRFLARQTARALGKRLLMVDMGFFGSMEQLLPQWRRILREVLLQPVLICVTGVEKRPSWESMVRILADEYQAAVKKAWETGIQDAPALRPLFFTAAEDVKLVPLLRQTTVQKRLPIPGLAERAALWDFFAEKYLNTPLPSQELAVKMKLHVGDIEKIVKRLACRPKDMPMESREIFRYCYELLDDGRYDSIKRVETSYTFDDLKLEESQKRIIRDICAQVEQRKKVMSDWNLQSRYSYGTSVSALFSGPPGTGKTMAVHVMAGILGLEMFKVDLSQIVDKYIGETEKRLDEVFRRAEQSNMILFFDEADAIIGKRSETKEAKDKYANTEVAYLLQRMEEYDGIVILATNYSQNIDAAFMRRIRFTVHFPLPDEARRKEIWHSAFAEETPRGTLDYEYLARQFEFSGGQIKNVVWNACFFAAEEGAPVEMRHIVRAIQMELTKDKKVSFQEALGEYARLIY